MRVYTYYDRLTTTSKPDDILVLWYRSWIGQGWTPRVIDRTFAAKHPNYKDIVSAVIRLPTVNHREYELACYLRHVAMELMAGDDGALLTDYDVINYSLTPGMLPEAIAGRDMLILEPSAVPCAVWANRAGWHEIVGTISTYQPDSADVYDRRPHVSDMTIFRRTTWPCTNLCVEVYASGKPRKDDLGDGWKTSPLVHFSTMKYLMDSDDRPATRKFKTKVQWIQALRPVPS